MWNGADDVYSIPPSIYLNGKWKFLLENFKCYELFFLNSIVIDTFYCQADVLLMSISFKAHACGSSTRTREGHTSASVM